MVDELPRLQQDTAPDSYTAQQVSPLLPSVVVTLPADGPRDTESGPGAVQGLLWTERGVQGCQELTD